MKSNRTWRGGLEALPSRANDPTIILRDALAAVEADEAYHPTRYASLEARLIPIAAIEHLQARGTA